MKPHLGKALASAFVCTALDNLEREYPHKPDHVLDSAADVAAPRVLHPVFYGSYDWHSAVHMHWLLVAVLRRFPDLPEAPEATALLDRSFNAASVAREAGYLRRPSAASFERPYGWAWLLKLAAETAAWAREAPHVPAVRWKRALAPLVEILAGRFSEYLPKLAWPVRTGVHGNAAFALDLALDWGEESGEGGYAERIRERALTWFRRDRDYPVAYEPGGEDFLSPGLIEAALMRRVLAAEAWNVWLDAFLPDWSPAALGRWLEPVRVEHPEDPRLAHLDGLNLSRAWCWRRLAAALPASDRRRTVAMEAARHHLDASLPAVAGEHYAGRHWLASFALLALI
jgi:hypothetical protein